MSSAAPPKITIKIHTILPLGGDYAVANGHTFTRYADGRVLKEIFTIIYRRRGKEWKLVYVHSGFFSALTVAENGRGNVGRSPASFQETSHER